MKIVDITGVYDNINFQPTNEKVFFVCTKPFYLGI